MFITQAGLQSLEEATFNKIPLLALPFMEGTNTNGQYLEFTLHKNTLKKAILDIVQDRKYEEKIKEISELITNRPMTR